MDTNPSAKYIYLSHEIDHDTPMYGNDDSFHREQLKSIKSGDTANTQRWKINNHTGTHIDLPRHFYNTGATLSDFDASFFISNRVCWLDISGHCGPGYIVNTNILDDFDIPEDTEVILLKTGFESYRGQDIYWNNNPGYADTLADYLRNICKSIRFFGFDTISLTSVRNKPLGKKAHLAFLGGRNPVIIIEDMRLSILQTNQIISEIIIAPLRVNMADGSPVTIVAKLD